MLRGAVRGLGVKLRRQVAQQCFQTGFIHHISSLIRADPFATALRFFGKDIRQIGNRYGKNLGFTGNGHATIHDFIIEIAAQFHRRAGFWVHAGLFPRLLQSRSTGIFTRDGPAFWQNPPACIARRDEQDLTVPILFTMAQSRHLKPRWPANDGG